MIKEERIPKIRNRPFPLRNESRNTPIQNNTKAGKNVRKIALNKLSSFDNPFLYLLISIFSKELLSVSILFIPLKFNIMLIVILPFKF
ncbi:MAG: hypothetical protein HeimC3_00090 [Candidatus Heimdallarchaeota archaeon LC_3]|nr:MAG: hypothetical protein HeimC3_50340 [Candidatus Heimdallarchaeota archaeon LC_3]OLS28050.1 MAG: hypothetical protein HeimC3_00090 [Candidatus Heimdallarchaeota archaeon LC_3]